MERSVATSSLGDSATARLTLLAPQHGLAIPALAGIETSCSYQPNSALIYQLCRVLVERGHADGALWNEAGRAALPFACRAVQRMVDRVWDSRLDEFVKYSLDIKDELGEAEQKLGLRGRLTAMVDTQMSGYLKIGPALDRLEQEHTGLGAAFFRLLQSSLAAWIRVYDHTDASYYEENLHEMMEQDDPENSEAYEFPLVDDAIPLYLREKEHDETHVERALLRHFRSGDCGEWIDRLLQIHRISRLRVRRERISSYYDDPPLPSLLVVFRQHDAVEACFDAEAQYFYEVEHEPIFAVPFTVESPQDCDVAIRSIATFFRLNTELVGLIEVLNKWEEDHARGHQHREEPPLQAHPGTAGLPLEPAGLRHEASGALSSRGGAGTL
jgi:hypothetical protein